MSKFPDGFLEQFRYFRIPLDTVFREICGFACEQ